MCGAGEGDHRQLEMSYSHMNTSSVQVGVVEDKCCWHGDVETLHKPTHGQRKLEISQTVQSSRYSTSLVPKRHQQFLAEVNIRYRRWRGGTGTGQGVPIVVLQVRDTFFCVCPIVDVNPITSTGIRPWGEPLLLGVTVRVCVVRWNRLQYVEVETPKCIHAPQHCTHICLIVDIFCKYGHWFRSCSYHWCYLGSSALRYHRAEFSQSIFQTHALIAS